MILSARFYFLGLFSFFFFQTSEATAILGDRRQARDVVPSTSAVLDDVTYVNKVWASLVFFPVLIFIEPVLFVRVL